MPDALATDGLRSPESRGSRLSDRFRRARVPALPTVLFADASEDYRAMARDALLEGRNVTDMRSVADGPQGAVTPRPSLIVVDADLPGTPDGLAAVEELKADPSTRRIPVVVLGDSDAPSRVQAAYDAGANTYIVKPVTFLALVRLMKIFTAYWLETAELPAGQGVA
jgi:CheY-like chemotaxis protein